MTIDGDDMASSRAAARRRWLVRGALALAGLAALGALVVVSGIIPVAASSGHWRITAWFLHFTMGRSVAMHSIGIDAPKLDAPRLVLTGAGHYESGCRFCHGAPGARMPPVPQASTPHPPPLSSHLSSYDDAELFYIVFHGVKFTGMPAWPARRREDEAWAVVAFLRTLSKLDGKGYRELVYGAASLYADGAPRVVQQRCARCHGAHGLGRGEGAFPRLAGQSPGYLREALEAYAEGARYSGIMQPLAAQLGPEELESVVRWYASQPLPSVGTGQRPQEATAQRLQDERLPLCHACHGSGGAPSHASFPRLAGQSPEYLEQQLRLFAERRRGGGRYAALMHTVVDWLQPEEFPRIARALAKLPSMPSPSP